MALQYVRGYFETIGLMFLITMRKYAENEIKAFEITQLTLLGVLITLGFIGADWYGDRNTMIIFETTSDPNYFSGFFLLPMAVALKKLRDNKIYTIICAALLALGAYMVFTSGSRGGLLGLAVMIMPYVFINAKGTKQRIIGICTAIGMAVIMWTPVIPILPEDVSSRFSIQKIIKFHGTGRGNIWLSMLNTIKHSSWELMYGRGIFAYHEMMIDGKLMHVVAHNQFIQSLYNQGIPANDKELAANLPVSLDFELGGLKFFLTHNRKDIPQDIKADIIIFGHSHKYHEENISGQVWLNPGSCGRKRFNLPITMAVMNVNDNEYSIEKIELEGE